VKNCIFVWILFGFSLSGFKFELEFKFESNLSLKGNHFTPWRAANLESSPTSLPAQPRPSSKPAGLHLPPRGCLVAGKRDPHRITWGRDDVTVVIPYPCRFG
jgi:hypothetical protein